MTHLNLLLLMQNAMRATMERFGDALEYPSIHAQVALGSEDLTVKVKPCPPRRHPFGLFQTKFRETTQGGGCK